MENKNQLITSNRPKNIKLTSLIKRIPCSALYNAPYIPVTAIHISFRGLGTC